MSTWGELTTEQRLLQESTSRFIESECPIGRVRQLSESSEKVGAEYFRQAAELGWFAMLVPEELGGGNVSGQGLVDAVLVATERGHHLQPGPFVPMNVAAVALATSGTRDQLDRILPAIVSGEAIVTWAIGDPGTSWGPGDVRVARCSGGFILSGCSGLVQDAHLSSWVLVTTNYEGAPTQFIVPIDTKGIKQHPMEALDVTRRFSQLQFDDARVPDSSVVGEVGGAATVAELQLQIALTLTVAESIGAMAQDFESAVEYAKTRTAFGRPIGSFQAIKHLLADTGLLLEASNAVTFACARAVDGRRRGAAHFASVAKAFVGDSGIDLAQNCFQVFGGIGYTWDHDQHLYLRRLTTDAALYGQPWWHREHVCQLSGI